MGGKGQNSPVNLFVVTEVRDLAEANLPSAGSPLMSPSEEEAGAGLDVESWRESRARRRALDWLRAALPRVKPVSADVSILGPADDGAVLLGVRTGPAKNGAQVVVTAVAVRDGHTAPYDPAPTWLTHGLQAAERDGTRLLSVSRAGTFYGRFDPL
jgi:hypothetical protein